MGSIVFWGIIRAALVIPVIWLLYGVMDYSYWWMFGLLAMYGVVLHPAMIQYRMFLDENKEVLTNSLCSSCKNFDKTAVICLIHDKHPSPEELPCEGVDWEPTGFGNEE